MRVDDPQCQGHGFLVWLGWDDDAGAILAPHVERLLVSGCPGTATKILEGCHILPVEYSSCAQKVLVRNSNTQAYNTHVRQCTVSQQLLETGWVASSTFLVVAHTAVHSGPQERDRHVPSSCVVPAYAHQDESTRPCGGRLPVVYIPLGTTRSTTMYSPLVGTYEDMTTAMNGNIMFATNAQSRTKRVVAPVTRSAVLRIEVWHAIQLPPDASDWSREELIMGKGRIALSSLHMNIQANANQNPTNKKKKNNNKFY